MTDLKAAIEHFKAAKSPRDVFGDISSTAELHTTYKTLARVLHPDRHGGSTLASDAMSLLNALYDLGCRQLEAGTWGKPAGATIKAGNTYTSVVHLVAGDISDVYVGDYERGQAILKVARDPRDRDLLANEARVLSELSKKDGKEARSFQRYLPRFIEQSSLKVGGVDRAVNIFEYAPDCLTLTSLIRKKGGALDPRHVAWIWRRMLELLDWVHREGYVHGGINPDHVLVFPKTHGVQLLDWSYAMKAGGTLKAISKAHRNYYPAEVLAKKPFTPGADLHMIAQCVRVMFIGAVRTMPAEYWGLLQACSLAPGRRYENAFEVYEVLDRHLRGLFGPPKFIPLEF